MEEQNVRYFWFCLVLVWFVSVAEAQSRKSRNGNLSPASPVAFAQVPNEQAQPPLPPPAPPVESAEDRLRAIERRARARLQKIEARTRQRFDAIERGQRENLGYLDSQVKRAERAAVKSEQAENRLTDLETGLEAKATKNIEVAETSAIGRIGETGAREAQQVVRAGQGAVYRAQVNANNASYALIGCVLIALAIFVLGPMMVRGEAKRQLAALLPSDVRREWQAQVAVERNGAVVNQHEQVNAERLVAEAVAAVEEMELNHDAASKETQRATFMLLDDARAIRERAEDFFRRGKYDLANQSAKQIIGGDGRPGLRQRMHEAMVAAEADQEAASVT